MPHGRAKLPVKPRNSFGAKAHWTQAPFPESSPIARRRILLIASCSLSKEIRPGAPPSKGAIVGSRPSCRSEEHTSELQSRFDLVCRLLLEKKKKTTHLVQTNHL